jgi:hypothetical protein
MGLDDMISIHAIPPDPANDKEQVRAQIPQRSFYFVRPDGYIGLCGGQFDTNALARYVAENLGVKKAIGVA